MKKEKIVDLLVKNYYKDNKEKLPFKEVKLCYTKFAQNSIVVSSDKYRLKDLMIKKYEIPEELLEEEEFKEVTLDLGEIYF